MTAAFRESMRIFASYGGGPAVWILYALSLVVLFLFLEDGYKRIVFIWTPLFVTMLFFFPPFYVLYSKVSDASTYYRVLWLLPSEVSVCAAACVLMERASKPVLKVLIPAAAAVLIMLTGSFTYTSDIASKAENPYHLPQNVMDICDYISPGEGRYEVCAVFPPELVYYVRQYRTDIRLVYGREMVEPAWAGEGWNGVYLQMAEPVICMEDLVSEARASERGPVKFYVLGSDRETDTDPCEAGLIFETEVGGYRVYRDPQAEAGTGF